MTVKAAYKYQLADHKKSIIIFYCVIFALLALVGVVSTSDGGVGGMESATAIFLFVSGLCAFKESFLMLSQNGISRKSMFRSRTLVTLTIAIIMAVIDLMILLLGKAILSSGTFRYLSLYEQIYGRHIIGESVFSLHISILIFNILMYAAFFAIGYFITILFYRLNKVGKIAVGAGVPVGLMIVLPMIDTILFDSKISVTFGKLFDMAFGFSAGNPGAAMITFPVIFVIFSILSWLLMRKAVVKA